MKRFLLRVILFSLLLFAVLSAMVLPITGYYESLAHRSDYNAYKSMNLAEKLPGANADILIMGNSRAAGHYNDTLLSRLVGKKCLNLGLSGFPFNYQYHILFEPYVQQNPAPRMILQEVSPWAFFDYVTPKYSIEMMPYINRPNMAFLKDLCPEMSSLDRFRLVRYAGRMGKVLKEIRMLKTDVGELMGGGYKPHYIKGDMPLEHDTLIINCFRRYIEECEQRNIELVLICSPIHVDDGLRYFDMEGFWKQIAECTQGKKVKILNFQDLYGSDIRYFKDAMHLNLAADDEYTRFVADTLKSLLRDR